MDDTFTANGDDDPRAARIGRILDEVCSRRARGEAVDEGEIVARNPDLADELRPHLALLRQLQGARGPADDLVDRGVLARSADGTYCGQFGPYKVVELIGRGGMGLVFKAYDESLKRTVALKLLRPELANDTAALTRFEREARAAAGLRHPNIVTIYAVGRGFDGPEARPTRPEAHPTRSEDHPTKSEAARPAARPSVPYIAMEYVDGPSLADVIRENVAAGAPPAESEPEALARDRSAAAGLRTGALDSDTIRRIFRELLQGLAAAHECGLIHRDIKSSNILLDQGNAAARQRANESAAEEAGQAPDSGPSCLCGSVPSCLPLVKIADFGLARMRSSQTQLTLDGSVLGTPEYMSPEQARGDERIDQRTDLYSAGVVLYEMLTGRTPFKADTPTATIARILSEEPQDPRQIDKQADPVLASLALRLMAKRPEDRFASAAETLRVLDTGGKVGRPRRWRSTRRWLVGVLGAGVLIAGAGWLASRASGSSSLLTEARVAGDRRTVEVRYGNDVNWKVFWQIRPERMGSLGCACVANLDGRARLVVVVGFAEPLDGAPDSLLALDAWGKELWRAPLASKWQWPDVKTRSAFWRVLPAVPGNLDGAPGDELVVVAEDVEEYPTRISIIDPHNGTVRDTLWHFGHINGQPRVIPKYFEDGRPAIVAWGCNNKLDGFDDGLRDGERQFAHWDIVHVLMVLDPRHLGGLGPPLVNADRLTKLRWPALHAAPVCAYAFLDRPYGDPDDYVAQAQPRIERAGWRESMPEDFAATIRSVDPALAAAGGDGRQTFLRVALAVDGGDTEPVHNPTLNLDRNLKLLGIGPIPRAAEDKWGTTKEFWEEYWQAIVHNGEYVNK